MTTPVQALPPVLAQPTNRALAVARLLAVASSQVGYREGQSANGSWNNDNAYGKWYGYNGVAWCAQFVSWCASITGYLDVAIPRHQYTPTGWNWFSARNQDVTTPQAGDIGYVYGYVSGENRSRVYHVFIVEKVINRTTIQTIEGNTNNSGSSQGNGVYRLQRTLSSRLRFARPDYSKVVTALPPIDQFKQDGSGFPLNAAGKRCMSYNALQYAGQHRVMPFPIYTAYRKAAMASMRALGVSEANATDDMFPEAWQALEEAIHRQHVNSIPDQWSFMWFVGVCGYQPQDSGTYPTLYNDWP